ncbi:HAD-like domain [Pseudocohnilembus persalinus]|uniref:HAD-like domain n=1 Tax=Pseudocohnilembus persalinus TaxID=266149 RepID=A0A0V0QET6_PSEPJ|nr:HAD-like domain [Pseudocohnilembus persalinus]|eukprot:KRX00687.1 HAD-like domain [Pseudocohnilembus persalinus]
MIKKIFQNKFFFSQSKKTLPLIASDIDGVIQRQHVVLPQVPETVRFLQENREKIMLSFLTNRTGVTEKFLSQDLSLLCQLPKNLEIQEKYCFQPFTPMRPIFKDQQNEPILIIGKDKTPEQLQNTKNILSQLGITKYILGDEYISLYPYLTPQSGKQIDTKLANEVSQRLGISMNHLLQTPAQMKAILLLSSPSNWEYNIQIILDLLSSDDGTISDKIQYGHRGHIPVYGTLNDLNYRYLDYPIAPRLVMGGFTLALSEIFKKYYGYNLNIQFYGKPSVKLYEYLEQTLLQYPENQSIKFGNRYMIGDNPESDIQGANKLQDWTTILVRTGVFQSHYEGQNDKNYPAKYVVDNFKQAVELICDLEKIQFKI